MTAQTQFARKLPVFIAGLAIVAALGFYTPSHAELLSYSSGWSLEDYSGSINVSGMLAPTATVQYAVFSPGNFYEAFGCLDPSSGTQFVYAYQLINAVGSDGIIGFTVGLDPESAAFSISEFTDPSQPEGTDAVTCFLNPTGGPYTSAVWDYSTNPIAGGAKSEILLFTSPHSPQWKPATVSGILAASGNVPSPGCVPEPLTLVSLAMAGLLFVSARYLRRTFI